MFNDTNMSHNEDESLWDHHHNDSNEFSTNFVNIVQRACTKMNLPEFQ